jgi:two-component system, cell cycle sensor histidine kinase and response regulator CckA
MKPSYKDLEQRIQALQKEVSSGKESEKACLEKLKNLEKAMFSSSKLVADAEVRSYQLELEMQQRQHSENINKTLFKISSAIHISESLEALFSEIHAALLNIMSADNFFIALYDKTNDLVSFPYLVDEREDIIPVLHNISTIKNSLTREVIFSREPLFITKTKKIICQSNIDLDQSLGVPSMAWLGIPLKIKDKIIGVMATQSYTDPDQYSMSDYNVFVSVSEQVALAIEQKRSSNKLLESEIKYKTILASIEDGYCEVDLDGTITFANKAMCKITGFSLQEPALSR